jgi:phosphoglycolate phosphatase-like HAD superfamily hydrolase
MTRPTRLVIFDLDGTLVDSRRAIVDAVARGVEEVAAASGLTDLRADRDAIRGALGLPADLYFRRILPDTLLQAADRVKRAATRYEVEALRAGEGALYPKTLESLERLRSAGFAIAVVSNAQREYFRAALDSLGLDPQVDHSECYEELPPGHQAPFKVQLLRRALDRRSASAAASFMVGDRAEDIEAGREVGCRTLGVLHGFGDREELRAADLQCADLTEMADWILAQPATLRSA